MFADRRHVGLHLAESACGGGHGQVVATPARPVLLLGGEVPDDQEAVFAGWRKALRLPNVKGIVAGRSLLYPADDDVAGAVDTALSLL